MTRFNQTLQNLQKLFISLLIGLCFVSTNAVAVTETALADKPIFSGNKHGNVALALSVEWPTAVVSSYKKGYEIYDISYTYLGYFDDEKCYSYKTSLALVGLLFNTGVDDNGSLLANNTQDIHWKVVAAPNGTSGTKINQLSQVTSNKNTTSSYLGANATAVKVGNYTYQSNSFTIPSHIAPKTVSVTFTLTADDNLSNLLVNDVSTGITSTASWNTPATVTIPAGTFTSATNSIKIVVNNVGNVDNYAGIRIDNMIVKSNNGEANYFEPQALANSHDCSASNNGRWSGNYLNWALTPVIDPFRLALTGGYRAVDEVGLTILEKAYGAEYGVGNTPNKTLLDDSIITKSTPFSGLATLTIRSHGLGNKFYITSLGDIENVAPLGSLTNHSLLTTNLTNVYEMVARNQVCKAGLLENNCTLYPNNDYKPTGLIQNNAEKLSFAAFGYLKDPDQKRDGGVLRAKMASIGPTGELPEWDANTGIFKAHPDATAETNSGGVSSAIKKSGVINYLNEFGLNSKGYKSYDPVSELYYTVGRYFRNKGNVTEYTKDATNEMKDGFPVIEAWEDPIKNSCDLNFIIGLGDVHTWNDANLPGSALRVNEPDMPKLVSDDLGNLTDTNNHYTDVAKSTNYMGALEGLASAVSKRPAWGAGNNSYYMAGLAYDLHTRDFRPTIKGTQTITTYWLDVLEKGFFNKNQFWLAAKYGGFEVPKNYEPYATNNTEPAKSTWDTNNDNDPDNYFRANEPRTMISGLNSAFKNMTDKVAATSSGFILSTPNIVSGNLSFAAKYDAQYWTGTVTGNDIGFDKSGSPTASEKWSTDTAFQDQLAGDAWDKKRRIATSNCSDKNSSGMRTCTPVEFRYNKLNGSNAVDISTVGTQTNVGEKAVNFLRGDISNVGIFRTRTKFLGDIVNSKIRAVGAPNAPYSEINNPGYAAFKEKHASRATVAYVGANDGMLHAFNGSDGTELFAYVPSVLFKGPTNTPNDNGLAALAKSSYIHRNYVDSSPVVVDVNFGTNNSPDWNSLLVGGLGKGGKSYFALNVTDPAAISTEAKLVDAVQWEFTHKDLGFSYGRPVIVKAGGKWIVILTSGYNNADGKGYFFILDAKTGELLKQIGVNENYDTDTGLAHATAFVGDGRDFSADAAYAGDLHGNIWRLDLTGAASNNFPTPTKIAELRSANNEKLPITVSPVVEVDESTSKRYVFVGTGQLLNEDDIDNTKKQSFFAIYDGTNKVFLTSSTMPTNGGGFPITRSKMVDHTNNVNAITVDAAKPMGYYIDFDTGFKVNVPIDSSAGTVAFATNKFSGDVCNVSAIYRGYALNYGTGKSLLVQNDSKIATQYYQGNGVISGVSIYKKPNSTNLSVNFSGSVSEENSSGNTSLDTESAAAAFQLLNWRSIPNND